jgi:hypothetical protein
MPATIFEIKDSMALVFEHNTHAWFEQMNFILRRFTILLLLVFNGIACDKDRLAENDPPDSLSPSDKELILNALAEVEREAQKAEASEPKINLPTLPGWSKTETRPLTTDDHGFSVGYEHESGLTVTLYQFTRGHSDIPNDLNSALVQQEMQSAKDGIEQAVQLGIWQGAKEMQSKTVQLGDSKQQALWSQYSLTVDGKDVASFIYVWTNENTFFKLRCTCRSEAVRLNQELLKPLLTALGSPTN